MHTHCVHTNVYFAQYWFYIGKCCRIAVKMIFLQLLLALLLPYEMETQYQRIVAHRLILLALPVLRLAICHDLNFILLHGMAV